MNKAKIFLAVVAVVLMNALPVVAESLQPRLERMQACLMDASIGRAIPSGHELVLWFTNGNKDIVFLDDSVAISVYVSARPISCTLAIVYKGTGAYTIKVRSEEVKKAWISILNEFSKKPFDVIPRRPLVLPGKSK